MRYLGCKISLVDRIQQLFEEKGLIKEGLTLFDAFCGTGTVAYHFRNTYNIVLNDNLHCATTFASGRLFLSKCKFSGLGFNPFIFFNTNKDTREGFFSKNYAPKLSGRMYFSDENAQRIDYIRWQIDQWKNEELITDEEYLCLLSSLLESVSRIANVAGVYGAYLKSWDPRAIKPLIFMPPADTDLEETDGNRNIESTIINGNLEDIIENVECDILYLDPPYTKNSYSVQYHILETLIQNDSPQLKGITGARPYNNISNNWSKPNKVHILFDYVVSKTKAKHIVFSYNTDGLMTKDFIIYVLKRYCYEDSVTCEEIDYKAYKNFQTPNKQSHKEYLFYGQKKPNEEVNYYCPLNYMGGKSPIINFIKPHLFGQKKLVELMGGGFNVGINTNRFESIVYNDINFAVANLVKMFREQDTYELLNFIEKTITKYALSKNDSASYNQIRSDYNNKYKGTAKEYWYLYVVVLYGFQQQLRFNSKYEFNNPVGESGFSDSVKEKVISYSRRIKEMKVDFHIGDYQQLDDIIDTDTVVYADPPYLITLGSYNDGKRGFNGWNIEEEERLLAFLDRLIKRGCKVIISNLIEYKGLHNERLCDWIKTHQVDVFTTTFRNRNETLIVSK